MKIILLTHSREVLKKTNTGRLVQNVVPHTNTVIWQRTQADEHILELIKSKSIALVYPEADDKYTAEIDDFENFILIDSTWQEARKIVNRSPYLQDLPRVKLVTDEQSSYQLRRNQIKGGLCTAECVIELLRLKDQIELYDKLSDAYECFIT